MTKSFEKSQNGFFPFSRKQDSFKNRAHSLMYLYYTLTSYNKIKENLLALCVDYYGSLNTWSTKIVKINSLLKYKRAMHTLQKDLCCGQVFRWGWRKHTFKWSPCYCSRAFSCPSTPLKSFRTSREIVVHTNKERHACNPNQPKTLPKNFLKI